MSCLWASITTLFKRRAFLCYSNVVFHSPNLFLFTCTVDMTETELRSCVCVTCIQQSRIENTVHFDLTFKLAEEEKGVQCWNTGWDSSVPLAACQWHHFLLSWSVKRVLVSFCHSRAPSRGRDPSWHTDRGTAWEIAGTSAASWHRGVSKSLVLIGCCVL